MLEVISGGDPVLRFKGRLLASRHAPRAEASAWLAARRAFLKDVRGVFVLGVGCGYHVDALARATDARICVLEHHPEIAEVALGLGTFDPTRAGVEVVGDIAAVRANPRVRDLVARSYVVLVHPASQASAPKFYSACREQLLGREWGALNWAWALKGLPSLDRAPITAAEPLTIHDLAQSELVADPNQRERMLIKALKELVK